jgi:hypothetical protein
VPSAVETDYGHRAVYHLQDKNTFRNLLPFRVFAICNENHRLRDNCRYSLDTVYVDVTDRKIGPLELFELLSGHPPQGWRGVSCIQNSVRRSMSKQRARRLPGV